MKKRNKILALLLAMVMCISALAGCGSEGTVSTEPSVTTEATPSNATEPVSTEAL